MRLGAIVCLVLVWSLGAQERPAPERPLPDPETFRREVRSRLETDAALQRDWTYVETRHSGKLDGNGRRHDDEVMVLESYPGLPGEDRWERVIEQDGRAVPARELERTDRERREEVEAYARKLARDPEKVAEAEAERAAKREEDRQKIIEDAFRVFEFRMLGRERTAGHDTIVVAIDPRPGVRTDTRVGGILRRFAGRAWISEAAYEMVRLEVEAIGDATLGWGLLARLHKGSAMTFERRRVDGVWLPARTAYTASARVLLLRRMRIYGESVYSDYRRFNVDTSSTFAPPSLP
ncbi:MAG: hypothetical protein FJW23_11665 [Acidimicrobiia bacterium]|nr:hypothetical protein [Acidimicrobiia bacterium]